MPTEAATYFAPGTLIGVDRDGTPVHVGDVVEQRDFIRAKWFYKRGVVRYDPDAFEFDAASPAHATWLNLQEGGNRVVRRWDDPRGPVQDGDPVLAPSSEPWDRTVRGMVLMGGYIFEADSGHDWHTPERGVPFSSIHHARGTLDTVTLTFTPDPKE